MADPDVKQQIVDKIKESNNILVTVSSDPSVDELSAALGVTLLINKLDKHGTAVFSGKIPPAIEFLDPEKTFENTVDSLRDFIIALDKEKADHLRYKVDGDVVKIFITPYRTTIDSGDLDFSQGDYNVELVIAIGVKSEADLDKALESHGRILHDATVASVSIDGAESLGSLNWVDKSAGSYSELTASLVDELKSGKNLLDEQISTAFLTGIVAATDRFSNEKTSPGVMSLAAQLMAGGANQQLIAAKLEEAEEIPPESKPSNPKVDSKGTAEIKEGESTKLPRNEEKKSTPIPEPPKKKEGDGQLTIPHGLKGDADEVAEQVASHNQEEAVEAAEDKLAAELAKGVATPEKSHTSAEDLHKELMAAAQELPAPAPVQPAPAPGIAPTTPVPPVLLPQAPERGPSIPQLGGTLNATTEMAAEEKKRELESDRNRTILTHGGGKYLNETPAYQAPLNSVAQAAGRADEPQVHDIFSAPPPSLDAIQPTPPSTPPPTLAELDAQNRANHTDALDAVHAAFEETPLPAQQPMSSPAGDANVPLPPLPPMPPMPDFSAPQSPLPTPMPPEPIDLPSTNPSMPTPPMPEVPQPGQPADPGQFKIPGQ